MARATRVRSEVQPGGRMRRVVTAGIVILVAVAAATLPAYRMWWRLGEASELGRGLALLEQRGCVACHSSSNGCLGWKADGSSPESLESIRLAVLEGREHAPGLAAAMPAAAGSIGRRDLDRVVMAAGALAGLDRGPSEPELEAGREVISQLGCEACHGVLGAGGVANQGSLTGEVPGWMGRSFADVEAVEHGLDAIIRQGSTPSALPLSGGAALSMPPYQDRLDSTELLLLTDALRWMHQAERGPSP